MTQPPPSVTGMHDVLPSDSPRWRALESAIHTMCAHYGFSEVRTPLCEYRELFERLGATSDVVEKEMYTFEDNGGRTLALRPEGTASAVRAYLGVAGNEPIARWYYVGAMFRGERPAKGRYRQFHQFGAEIYGDPGPSSDAEVLSFAYAFVRSLGLDKIELRINSLGSREARARHRDALVAHFTPVKHKLSADSQRRLETNPLRVIDSKAPEDIALREGAPTLLEFLSAEDQKHFDTVKSLLTAMGIPFVLDPTIVRGLDYYTRTIFEIKDVSGALGAQDTLVGGGRYDHLIEEMGGRPTPAIGFGMGLERLLLAAPERVLPKDPGVIVVALAKPDDATVCGAALAAAHELRAAGITVHMDTRFGKADRQFRLADKTGARIAVVFGASEVASNTVGLKDLLARTQSTASRTELLSAVRTALASSSVEQPATSSG